MSAVTGVGGNLVPTVPAHVITVELGAGAAAVDMDGLGELVTKNVR